MPTKKIIIIAGPNGAGKTTFAQKYLPQEGDFSVFINADLISAGLSPFQPGVSHFRAGRLLLQEINRHVLEGASFAFETTLSGRGYVRRIREWRENAYHVSLIFLSLATPEEAVKRVKFRVRHGGHDIPEDVIRRRFKSGLKNFKTIYRGCVDGWTLYDNSGTTPVVLEQGKMEAPVKKVSEEKPDEYSGPDQERVIAALKRAYRYAHFVAYLHETKVVTRIDGKVVELDPDPEIYEEFLPDRRRKRPDPEDA